KDINWHRLIFLFKRIGENINTIRKYAEQEPPIKEYQDYYSKNSKVYNNLINLRNKLTHCYRIDLSSKDQHFMSNMSTLIGKITIESNSGIVSINDDTSLNHCLKSPALNTRISNQSFLDFITLFINNYELLVKTMQVNSLKQTEKDFVCMNAIDWII